MFDYVGTATYSPEDDKLRLYPRARLDAETYAEVKAHGFRWAPKQELFFAVWTVAREDLMLKLAGDIEPESMTLAERAELKAERLAGYARNRVAERNAYQRAADSYAERFHMGQPILVGHHSERSARVAQKRMNSALEQAAKRERTADWHLYRAAGALAHAEHLNSDRTRANRIQTLLSEYREAKRSESKMRERLRLFRKCETEREFQALFATSSRLTYNEALALAADPMKRQEYRARNIAAYEAALAPDGRNARAQRHILNRLGYERELLGPVPRYAGEITPGVVQVFARTWGVEGPKGHVDGEEIGLTAAADLPPFISDNPAGVTMTSDAWRDLFQALGYEPPAAVHSKASTSPPLLNLDVAELQCPGVYSRGDVRTLPVIHTTKAAYSKVHADYKGTRTSLCGQYRFRVVMKNALLGAGAGYGLAAVFLADSKAHPVPQLQQVAA